eukprot:8946904-Pyramimonas_sp.AAC.1
MTIQAAWGENEIVELLLAKGAEVNAADSKKFTALHYACYCNQRRTASYLLGAGASIRAQTITGETPCKLCSDPEVRRRDPLQKNKIRLVSRLG